MVSCYRGGLFIRLWTTALFLGLASSAVAAKLNRSIEDQTVAGFIPKKWPSIVAIVLYGLSGLVHWYLWYKWGKRYMLTLTIGMSCITLGFILRIVYSNGPDSLGLYIITTMFVLLSPCAFLATDYIILTRLAQSLPPKVTSESLLITPTKIVRIFVWSDVATFLLQAAGGGLSATQNQTSANLGKDIALVGLILQLLSFGLFTLLLLVFGWRVENRYPQAWRPPVGNGKNLRILFFTCCFTCLGILIRSVFRIIEYSEGYRGFLALHEGYFYLFDALPLWIAMTAYCVIWPGRYIPDHNVAADMERGYGDGVGREGFEAHEMGRAYSAKSKDVLDAVKPDEGRGGDVELR